MQCFVTYGEKTYGNSANVPEYMVRLTRRGGRVEVDFEFKGTAAGLGAGPLGGNVMGGSLVFPVRAAGALSHALQLVLSETASHEVEFAIDEDAKG